MKTMKPVLKRRFVKRSTRVKWNKKRDTATTHKLYYFNASWSDLRSLSPTLIIAKSEREAVQYFAEAVDNRYDRFRVSGWNETAHLVTIEWHDYSYKLKRQVTKYADVYISTHPIREGIALRRF